MRDTIEISVKKHEPYTLMAKYLIEALLNSKGIKFFVVEARTKEVPNILEKIERKRIKDFKSEILDITGIRIILYYIDDLDVVEQLIIDNFKIDPVNSVNKENLYDSHEFGYLSRHYIVTPNNERSKLTEWKEYSSMNAEIQVRTVLQHAWASISHELSYKKSHDIPKALSRKLNRLAGIFELADEEFLDIKNQHNLLKDEVDNLSESDIQKEEINALTIYKIISDGEGVFRQISNFATVAGFRTEEFESSEEGKYISNIIQASELHKVSTIGDLEGGIATNIKAVEALFFELMKYEQKGWIGNSFFYALIAVLYLLDDAERLLFSNISGWSNSNWDNVNSAISKIQSKN